MIQTCNPAGRVIITPLPVNMDKTNNNDMTNPSPDMLMRFQKFAQWVKLAIERSGLGVGDVAVKASIGRPVLYTYMRNCLGSDGRYRKPSEDMIRRIASATGASVEDGFLTMGYSAGPPPSVPGEISHLPVDAQSALAKFIQTMTPNDIVYLPRIGKVGAGLLVRESISDYGFEKVGILKSSIPEKIPVDELFVLKVTGYCLTAAYIADGDSLICRRADSANSGDVVIVIEDDEAIAKRYKEDSTGKWLETDPASGKPQRVKVGPGARIFGVAISRTGPIH